MRYGIGSALSRLRSCRKLAASYDDNFCLYTLPAYSACLLCLLTLPAYALLMRARFLRYIDKANTVQVQTVRRNGPE